MNFYGVERMNTIGKKVGVYNQTEDIVDSVLHGAKYYTWSTVRGYINKDKKVVFEYNGKYGKGFVVCVPSTNPYTHKPSTSYMDITYYILPEEQKFIEQHIA